VGPSAPPTRAGAVPRRWSHPQHGSPAFPCRQLRACSCLALASHLGFQRRHPRTPSSSLPVPLWAGDALSPDPGSAAGSARTTASPSHTDTRLGPLLVPEHTDLTPKQAGEPQLPPWVSSKPSTHRPSPSQAPGPPPSPPPGHIGVPRNRGSDRPHRHTWGGQSQSEPCAQRI